MIKHQDGLVFSRLFSLNYSSVNSINNNASLYMICKKNTSGDHQVIFAGIATNLKSELLNYIEKNCSNEKLFFCYVKASPDSINKYLYQQVA